MNSFLPNVNLFWSRGSTGIHHDWRALSLIGILALSSFLGVSSFDSQIAVAHTVKPLSHTGKAHCFEWSPRSATAFTAMRSLSPGTSRLDLYFFVQFDFFEGNVYFSSSGTPAGVSVGFTPSSIRVPPNSGFTETRIVLTISTSPSFSGSFDLTLTMDSPDGKSYSDLCEFRNISERHPVTIAGPSQPTPLSVGIRTSALSGRPPLTVQFSATVTGGTSPYQYTWSFEDGQSSTLSNPSHTFAKAGTYVVRLTVRDSAGSEGTASVSITVKSSKTKVEIQVEDGFQGLIADRNTAVIITLKAVDAETGAFTPGFPILVTSRATFQQVDSNTLRLKSPLLSAKSEGTVQTDASGLAKIIVGPWIPPFKDPRRDPSGLLHEILEVTVRWKPSPEEGFSSVDKTLRIYQPPVLLVHGTCASSSTWYSAPGSPGTLPQRINFIQQLKSEGLKVSTIDYVKDGDIGIYYRRVMAGLGEIKDELKKEKIKGERFDVVAHSLGGLMSRFYTRTRDYQGDINHLIMLGTPNNGFYHFSSIAKWYRALSERVFGGAPLRFDEFLECLSGPGEAIKQQNLEHPVGAEFLRQLNSLGLHQGVRHYAIMGTSSILWFGGGYSDGLVKHESTHMFGQIPGFYVKGNHVDLTGSQEAKEIVAAILLGKDVPSRHLRPPSPSSLKMLMSVIGGEVNTTPFLSSSRSISKGYWAELSIGELLSAPAGASARVAVTEGGELAQFFVGSTSVESVAEFTRLDKDRVSVLLYTGQIGVVANDSGRTPVSVVVPGILPEIASQGTAFTVRVRDDGTYSVTLLEGKVSLRQVNGSVSQVLSSPGELDVDKAGKISPTRPMKSNWPQVKTLVDYFKSNGLEVSCQEFLNIAKCEQVGRYSPTVSAYDTQRELRYIGEAVTCDDVEGRVVGEKLTDFSGRVMTSGQSRGKEVPLVIAVPETCEKDLNKVVNSIGLAEKPNIRYLIAGRLTSPSLTIPPLVVSASSTRGPSELTVSFGASAQGGRGPYAFTWNFGDNSTSAQQNPVHTYKGSGSYTAILTVRDAAGAEVRSSPLNIVVKVSPNAALTLALIDYFKSKGLEVICSELEGKPCQRTVGYILDVEAYDRGRELRYYGLSKTCDELQSLATGGVINSLGYHEMNSSISRGARIPLIVSIPDSCTSEQLLLPSNPRMSTRPNVSYLIAGRLNEPPIATITPTTRPTARATPSTQQEEKVIGLDQFIEVALGLFIILGIPMLIGAPLIRRRRSKRRALTVTT